MYIDLLIRMKNAGAAKKSVVKSPFSTMDQNVAEVLRRYGFLTRVEVKGRTVKKYLEVELNKDRPIQGLKLVSKPSLRRYRGYRDLKPVKGGHGIVVLTTPSGLKSGVEARKEKVGGQVLFEIW